MHDTIYTVCRCRKKTCLQILHAWEIVLNSRQYIFFVVCQTNAGQISATTTPPTTTKIQDSGCRDHSRWMMYVVNHYVFCPKTLSQGVWYNIFWGIWWIIGYMLLCRPTGYLLLYDVLSTVPTVSTVSIFTSSWPSTRTTSLTCSTSYDMGYDLHKGVYHRLCHSRVNCLWTWNDFHVNAWHTQNAPFTHLKPPFTGQLP